MSGVERRRRFVSRHRAAPTRGRRGVVAGTIGGALTGSVFSYVVDAVGGRWKQNLAGAILSGGIVMFGRFHTAKSPKTGYAWLIFMLTFLIVVNDGWKVVAGDNVISHSFETALWRTVHVALGCVIIVATSRVVFPNYARKTLRLQTGVIVGSLSSAYHALTMNHISEGDDIREVKLDECVAIAKSISAARALLYPASAEVYLRESVRRQYFQTTAWTNLLKELMSISSVITALQVNTMDEEFVGVASEDEELREILVSLSRWIVESLLIVKTLLTHSTSSLMFHDLTLSARIRRAVPRRTSGEASRIERRREQSFLAPSTTNPDRSVRYAGVLSASLDACLNEWTVVTTVVGEDDADGIATTKPPVVVPVLSLADRSVAASARVERRVRHLRARASASRTVGAAVRVGVGRSVVDRAVVPPASSWNVTRGRGRSTATDRAHRSRRTVCPLRAVSSSKTSLRLPFGSTPTARRSSHARAATRARRPTTTRARDVDERRRRAARVERERDARGRGRAVAAARRRRRGDAVRRRRRADGGRGVDAGVPVPSEARENARGGDGGARGGGGAAKGAGGEGTRARGVEGAMRGVRDAGRRGDDRDRDARRRRRRRRRDDRER